MCHDQPTDRKPSHRASRGQLNLGPGGPLPSVRGPRIRALLDAYGWQDREGIHIPDYRIPCEHDQRDGWDRRSG